MEKIKIVIAGPRGRMGKEAVRLVEKTENFELVAVIDHKYGGKLLNELEGFQHYQFQFLRILKNVYQTVKADVLIDLTTPEVGMKHTKTALELVFVLLWEQLVLRRKICKS